MEPIELEKGDVVQLNPDHKFGAFLVLVTEPKKWGCQGYLLSAVNFDAFTLHGLAYIRADFEEFEYVGKLKWMPEY